MTRFEIIPIVINDVKLLPQLFFTYRIFYLTQFLVMKNQCRNFKIDSNCGTDVVIPTGFNALMDFHLSFQL